MMRTPYMIHNNHFKNIATRKKEQIAFAIALYCGKLLSQFPICPPTHTYAHPNYSIQKNF